MHNESAFTFVGLRQLVSGSECPTLARGGEWL